MSGIAGLFRPNGAAPDDVHAVKRMVDAQVHRGPAIGGMYDDEYVVLGHRRLPIIDLSAAGNQPMANEDGSICLTYNGEIYNHVDLRDQLVWRGHQFQSHSDTEVILHGYEEWGVDGLLEKLRGMFAFALFDQRLGLVLARDRLGIKPLYYHLDAAGGLLFASEVKALMASGLAPNERDMKALAGFLLGGSVPAPRTIVDGVSSLLPGHYIVYGRDGVKTRKYWDLPSSEDRGAQSEGSLDEAFTKVGDLLRDSVFRHLYTQVPLGIYLSGGVDSDAMVALASLVRTSSQPLTTLTVTYDEKGFRAGRWPREVARRFQTKHHEARVTRGEFVDEIPRFLAAMDQPTMDGVNTYFVSKAAREAGLTVLLSGLGGDEVFWGYPHYRWLSGDVLHWLARSSTLARKQLSRGAALWSRVRGGDKWTRLDLLEARASARELYMAVRGFFTPRHVMDLLDIGQRDLDAVLEEQFDACPPDLDHAGAREFNYIEFKRYLHDQLLRDTDVFSMAHSIEVRVPFLDHPIVEYATGVGATLKMAKTINKPLLVGAVADAAVLESGEGWKRGCSFPMDRWMKASDHELEEMAVSGRVLNRRVVGDLWKEFRRNRLHWSRAWALSVLGATEK